MGHDTLVEVDDVRWFAGYDAKPIVGPCPHTCQHRDSRVIAWGPSLRHYELIQCDDEDGCQQRCRAWERATPTSNGGIRNSHPWMEVEG